MTAWVFAGMLSLVGLGGLIWFSVRQTDRDRKKREVGGSDGFMPIPNVGDSHRGDAGGSSGGGGDGDGGGGGGGD